tara:strand:+ start:1351 stop:1863 length:513 start_codon:yes stop_codon:yes gene_type:complete
MSTLKVNKLIKVSGQSKFVLQVHREVLPELNASSVNDYTPTDAISTSNTTSLHSFNFTPVSQTSKIIGHYMSQEDGQGTNGWTTHACFVGGNCLAASTRYLREQGTEPYSQVYSFSYDHNATSAITFDLRYGRTAGIYIVINRYKSSNTSGSALMAGDGNTGIILYEVEQ